MDENPIKKFAFFGTPELAVEILEELKANNRLPAVVTTAPDRPKGRLLQITPSPVKNWAIKNKIPVLAPETLDDTYLDSLKKSGADFGVVVAYGKILSQTVLKSLPLGFFNVHYSLLPRYRGATPVEAAILSGDTETGVAIQKVVPELDAGPIIALEKTEIGADETAPELRHRLNEIAKKLLAEIIPRIETGQIMFDEQEKDGVIKCKKIKKEDGLISLSDDGSVNYKKYRAYFGWPGVYFFENKNGKQIRVNVKKASFRDGQFIVDSVVPEGKKEVAFDVWKKSFAK